MFYFSHIWGLLSMNSTFEVILNYDSSPEFETFFQKHFVQSVYEIFSQKSCGSSKCFLVNLRQAICSFWSVVVLALELSHGGYFCQVSLFYCQIMTTEANEACRVLNVALHFFVVSRFYGLQL